MYYRQKGSNYIETPGARIWNGNWHIAYFSHQCFFLRVLFLLPKGFSLKYSDFVASIIILFLMLNAVIGKPENYLKLFLFSLFLKTWMLIENIYVLKTSMFTHLFFSPFSFLESTQRINQL